MAISYEAILVASVAGVLVGTFLYQVMARTWETIHHAMARTWAVVYRSMFYTLTARVVLLVRLFERPRALVVVVMIVIGTSNWLSKKHRSAVLMNAIAVALLVVVTVVELLLTHALNRIFVSLGIGLSLSLMQAIFLGPNL
uniref:Uncharacterized protein n=1 Tax=Nelumbo nucifera TaxID=4432 RepID=A0A822XDD6_NELNU|nr:TPA_asm: hypothetical protein HUJ06_019803 [Nelumbo nucifera]